jgi:hypothetical protein
MKHAFILGCLLIATATAARALEASDLEAMDTQMAAIQRQLPLQTGANAWVIEFSRDGTRLHTVMMIKGKQPATREWRDDYVASTCIKERDSLERGWRYSDTIVDENGVLLAQVFLDKGICASLSR